MVYLNYAATHLYDPQTFWQNLLCTDESEVSLGESGHFTSGVIQTQNSTDPTCGQAWRWLCCD